jgi:glycogen debranching enzyme
VAADGYRIQLRARYDHLIAYSGLTTLVTAPGGEIPGGSAEGYFAHDTRLLSRFCLLFDGQRMQAVAASPAGADRLLAYLRFPGAERVHQCSFAELHYALGERLEVLVILQNYHAYEVLEGTLAIGVAADFADMNDVESGTLRGPATVAVNWDDERRAALFRYAHPNLDLAADLVVEEGPRGLRWDGDGLQLPLRLEPHEPVRLRFALVDRSTAPARAPFPLPRFARDPAPVRERLRAEMPELRSTNHSLARAWETAVGDLASLPLGLDPGPAAPAAGVPLYQRFFARDVLTAGWQSLLAGPVILRDALRLNAAFQGQRIDDWRDEEPGKLAHQVRWGPNSLTGVDPVAAYYGDYAAPQDFLAMLAQYLAWTGDRATVRELLPAARKALTWLERYGDIDGDGFLEYETRSSKGVKHQGWKDSPDAIVDDRGEQVGNPFAPCEIQGYWYAGLQQMAWVMALMGDAGYGMELRGKARALRRRFNQTFWLEAEGLYALGLGPDKELVRSPSSNSGHLLATGIVPPERAGRLVERLLEPDLFSGWGIRTLSSRHPAFNPFSYHLGSVWPVENGTFAFGLARYGHWNALHQLARAILDCSDLFGENRLPEVVGGIQRDRAHPHPGLYPGANEPQAWSASMVVMLVQSLLALNPVAPLGVAFLDPHLPEWCPDIELRNVRIGNARLDLRVWREVSGRTVYRSTVHEGRIRLIRQPPPQSGTSLVRRLGAALLGR